MLHRLLALIACAAALLATPLNAQDFPELTGRVVDAADIIPAAEEAALNAKLEALETQSQRQFVIATIPDLQGYDIADYGYQLGRAWGIGDKERNDGVLLIVAPNDRKTRIEVGYGVEPVLTDGLSTLIVQKQMLPLFRGGDYPGGINAAADTIIRQLTLPEEEARAIAAKAVPQKAKGKSGAGIDVPTLIFLGFFLFFIIIPMFRSGGKGGRRFGRNGTLTGSGVGDIILWEVANAALRGSHGSGRHGSGGFGGFSGGGGGGFSGGGGSFGGGGASGGW